METDVVTSPQVNEKENAHPISNGQQFPPQSAAPTPAPAPATTMAPTFPPPNAGMPQFQAPPHAQPGFMPPRAPAPFGGPPPGGELWIETKTEDGKPYYYHAMTRQTTWTRPMGPNVQVMTQQEVEQMSKQQQTPANRPPAMGMPPGGPGAIPRPFAPPFGAAPQMMPPFGLPPPAFAAPQQAYPWGNIHPTQWLAIKKDKDVDIDPAIIAKAAEWTEHQAPDGRPYYYHAGRGESVWEKPQPLKDLEEAKAAAASKPSPVHPHLDAAKAITLNAGTVKFDSLGFIIKSDPKADEEERKKKEAERKRREEEEKAKKPIDKSRPISSTPISGTPWCVVWTGDGRVFFYNPSTRTSLWERPDDLAGRADVDKAVRTPPEALLGILKDESKQNESILKKKKRSDSESSTSSEETASKKAKVEEEKKDPKEAAMDAEAKAAKERANIPLEQRIQQFKDMLREKDVSAFSTWEKELHKIVFDPRYLLLTSRERKQVFEKYVKDRAEEERREKRNKMRQKRDDFRSLMEYADLHGKSTFGEFASKWAKDDRFKGIEKMRERESLFNEYIVEVRKREKEEKAQRKDQIRKEFFSLLREHKDIDRHSRWSDVKKRVESDSRYKSVGDSVLREDYFYEYCKILKDEKKRRDKEKKREKKEKKRKDKDKEPRSKEGSEEGETKDESDEKGTEKDDSDKEDGEHPATEDEKDLGESEKREKDRQARAEASIKEREKEVQRTLATQMRDLDKEREHHKRDEAMRHFTALLADLVRNADVTWKEAKKQLKKDHRWELCETLEREDRDRLFAEHVEALTQKKRDKFREMLDELTQLELTSGWKEIKKLVRDDPRYTKFSSSSERCEKEFREYIKDKTATAIAAFRELLQETKLITYRSLDTFRENPNHLKEIEEILKMDKRYLVLDHMAEDRAEILMAYLEDLHKRGPPPPPTASESSRRK